MSPAFLEVYGTQGRSLKAGSLSAIVFTVTWRPQDLVLFKISEGLWAPTTPTVCKRRNCRLYIACASETRHAIPALRAFQMKSFAATRNHGGFMSDASKSSPGLQEWQQRIGVSLLAASSGFNPDCAGQQRTSCPCVFFPTSICIIRACRHVPSNFACVSCLAHEL